MLYNSPARGRQRVGHRTSATMAANNASETPALIEIWKVLMQIKTNTEKLV